MKRFEDIIQNLDPADIKEYALAKKAQWAKEWKQKSKKVVKEIKNIDLSVVDNPLVDSVVDNINQAVEYVSQSDWVDQAKDKLATTKKQVMTVLDIPTQTEITKLTKKLSSIEKKLDSMGKKKRVKK